MFTICLLGNSGTGKTSWFNRVSNGTWSPKFRPTMKTVSRDLKLFGDETVVTVRDIAGQLKYNPDTKALTGVDTFFVFADDSTLSQEHVKEWISIGRQYSPNARIVVIINKCDIKHVVAPSMIDGRHVIHILAKTCTNFTYNSKLYTAV